MNKKDHPRGLSPEERGEWHALCERLFDLYNKMPMKETKRKVIAGCDEKNKENILIFFKGTKEELFALREMLQ
jgi:hypothetical protein